MLFATQPEKVIPVANWQIHAAQPIGTGHVLPYCAGDRSRVLEFQSSCSIPAESQFISSTRNRREITRFIDLENEQTQIASRDIGVISNQMNVPSFVLAGTHRVSGDARWIGR